MRKRKQNAACPASLIHLRAQPAKLPALQEQEVGSSRKKKEKREEEVDAGRSVLFVGHFECVEVIWFLMKRMKGACAAASSGHERIFYSKKGIAGTL